MYRVLPCLLLTSLAFPLQADDWPHWMGPTRDNIWQEKEILEKFPEDGLKPLWKTKIGGGYGGPAVAKGRIYLGDFLSDVDLKAEVYERGSNKGIERVLCLDEKTGQILWKHEYPCTYTISFPNGPRCTPAVSEGKVYMVGAEGNLTCLDAESGKRIWSKDFKQDYGAKTPLWGFAGHPYIDGQKVICMVGGEGACVVAFDKATGKELWKALTAREPGYGSPSIIESAGVRQLLVWHSDSVNSLDPETGKRYWFVPLKPTNGASIMAPMKVGDHLFVGGYDGVCKTYKLLKDKPGVEEIWTGDRRKGLYPINAQPIAIGEHLYGCCAKGELRCMEITSGKRLWSTLDPINDKGAQCATVFPYKNHDRFFLFTDLGELIIANLTPKGYEEISRTKIIEPTSRASGRDVVFSAPAFANRNMYVRNDKEIVGVSLAK
jgi:outer membrane protein assembly factor BamB